MIMKLRVRIREPLKKTVVLELGGSSPTAGDLHQQAINALNLPEQLSQRNSSFISLNGTDPIGEDHLSLEQLGIVQGDLVIFVVKEDILKEQQQLDKVHDQSVQNPGTPAPMDTDTSGSAAVSSEPESNRMQAEEGESSAAAADALATADALMKDVEQLNSAEVNQYLRKTMMIRDSGSEGDIPDSLQNVLKQTVIENAHDVLFLTLHVLMQETGFIVSKSSDVQNQIPITWKSPGIYKIHYSYSDLEDMTFELLGVPMAGLMVIYGSLQGADGSKQQLKLKVAEYVSLTTGHGPKFSNLQKLSREFKDSISYALVQLNAKDFAVPSLSSLFLEVKVLILQNLDAKSLLKLSQTCKGFNDLCKSPALWYRLFLKRWGKSKTDGTDVNKDWHKLYKDRYRRMLEMREVFYRARVVVPPYFQTPHPEMVHPPPWVPPLGIGGDYDREPGFPMNPFGPNRGIGPMPPRFQPRAPMRPRFYPFGPEPDMFMPPRMGGQRSRGIHRGIPRPTFRGGMPRFF